MNTPGTADVKHNNWLTVGEALRITKIALVQFLQQVVDNWHGTLLNDLEKEGPCTNQANCQSFCYPKTMSQLCCSCKSWYDELKILHRGKHQCWSNSDCTKWATPGGAWEVAKVFMSDLHDSKSDITNAETTDVASLLNLLRFLPVIAFPSSTSVPPVLINNVSKQARNPWAHSSQQEMEEKGKEDALDSLENLLKEPLFSGSPEVSSGLGNLHELRKDGVANVSQSEIRCMIFLGMEFSRDVAQLKCDLEALRTESTDQGQDIKQLQTKFTDVLSLVNTCLERSNSLGRTKEVREMKQLVQVSKLLKKQHDEVSGMKHDCENLKDKQATLELKQQILESRQDTLDDRIERKMDHLSQIVQPSPKSHVPDYQENVFGRETAITDIANLIERKPCVLLTGGPGFGKTTVAIQVANKLSESRTVIFISLREVCSINNIRSRILSMVGRNPQEKEEEELIQWTRSLNEDVILVLDNAEDALQLNLKNRFCELLQNLRTGSGSHLRFLITSRENFELSNMEVKPWNIEPLNNDEGVKVIRSRMSENISGADIKKLYQLANLCGGIPLALRIVGSLVEVVEISSLVKELESDPMEVLEDESLPNYHKSVRVAIECSFSRLSDSLKTRLVRLSIFGGSFDTKAASAIWEVESNVTVGKTLKQLTEKSLLGKLGGRRYELHPIVQTYLKDKGKGTEYDEDDVTTAGNNFMRHYVSMVINGTKLYWSKDKFSDSMEIFRNDTLNIEKVLQMCSEQGKIDQRVLLEVRWICFYLEKCISYQNIDSFLRLCLRLAENQNKKGCLVEVHCLIGHYEWKKGNKDGYKEHMDNAESLFEEDESRLNMSQKWFYKLSISFYLDQQRLQASSEERNKLLLNQAIEKSKEALEILPVSTDNGNSDRAVTLRQLGTFEKHRGNYDEAEKWFRAFLKERRNCLGEGHILTAMALKCLADFHLTKKENEKALELYKETLDTYERIDMREEKQCIYLLKNMAYCYWYLHQRETALRYLEEALEMAERLLESDHKVIEQMGGMRLKFKTDYAGVHN